MKQRKEKKRRAAEYTSMLAAGMDLPPDAMMGNAHIEILGNTELNVDGHRGVLAYGDTCVKLSLSDRILVIEGERLLLRNLTPDGATVTGSLRSITYET